ncbi:MAG: hypothetical protein EAZ07_01220 [Cytophagales bacterium]|nr:MAG: hypothetical protein EAZ07_01220 [Cytophagales bacterium]
MFNTIRQEFRGNKISLIISALLSFIYVSIAMLMLLGGTLYYHDIYVLGKINRTLILIKFVNDFFDGSWYLLFQWGFLSSMIFKGFGTWGIVIGGVMSFLFFWKVFNYLIYRLLLRINKTKQNK